jgi:lipoprotein-anchoring transpeptidase ErfK/SrfK
VSTSPTPTANASPSPTAAHHKEAIVVTTAVERLGVFVNPGDASAKRTLGRWSYYGSPLTLLEVGATTIDGKDWVEVLLPARPNGQTGWVRASDVTLSTTDVSIWIYIAERELDLYRGDDLLLTTPIVVGADDTPTPRGLFYVTDPLDFTANPAGIYGAYALGLSAFSEVLSSFNGYPPQVAIHGTNQPELLGTAASNGCIRLPNDAVLEVAEAAGLGTPVYIYASRVDGP